MRHCLAFVVVLGLLCCPALGSSIFADLLTLDGNVDTINDNSRAVIFDNDDDDHLSIGDEIVGVLQFEKVNDSDPSPAGLFGIFAFKVVSERQLGLFPIQEHGPITSGDHRLSSILDEDLRDSVTGFTDWDNAIFAFVEIPSLGSNDPKDPFSTTNSEPTDDPLGIIKNVMTAANGYSVDAIVGFGQDDDFLSTLPNVAIGFLIGNKDGDATITEIRADDSGNVVVMEKAGLSVLYDVIGGTSFLQLGIEDYGMAETEHDIILTPDGTVQTSTVAAPNWDLEDDSNFQINPVPEPGTVTLLITLVAMLGLVRVSRRK